jgi:hypothetical protein
MSEINLSITAGAKVKLLWGNSPYGKFSQISVHFAILSPSCFCTANPALAQIPKSNPAIVLQAIINKFSSKHNKCNTKNS